MKGCCSVILGVFCTIALFCLVVGASNPPPTTTAAFEPKPAPVVRQATPPPAAHGRPHRRHHRHHAPAVASVVDPFPFDESLHLTAWGRFEVDEIGITHIHGTAINNTGHDLSYAQVSFRLLDRSGAQVGTAITNTADLPNGARWKFDAMGSGEGVFHHSAAELTGF